MLAEWLRSVTTPCPRHVRAMGYLRELIAIEARHRRCRAAWAPHLENCKKVILKAADAAARGRVTVLGSGHLLDVPIEALAGTFDDVVLVDILHMPKVRRVAREFPNVRVETADITGVARPVFEHVRAGRAGALPAPRADAGLFADSDLVVSANVLTQLPLGPMGYVRRKSRDTGEDETRALARRIVEHHLELLAALPGPVALLTETERVIADGEDVLQTIDPLFGAEVPRSGLKWVWNIAPRPELSSHYDLYFAMTGISDFKAALG